MTRFHKYMGALVGAAAALGLAQAAAAQPQPLKIGVIMPLTGELADYGATSLNGIKLAADEINKAGGVHGAPVTLAIGDDQTSPQSGVSAAQKLVSVEKASILIGPMGSGVFIPVAKTVALPAGIPIITGSATSPVISTLDQGKGLVFRSVPSDAFQGVALADVAQNKGYKSVGVIYINNDYGKGLAENF
ncbi:MAG: ABC transporter substrate-binding protein, partial [Rhodospirillaceae bacterium]|nr:ABC transporter substrate-binding protein [Rhodospirillaceae bacterium]